MQPETQERHDYLRSLIAKYNGHLNKYSGHVLGTAHNSLIRNYMNHGW